MTILPFILQRSRRYPLALFMTSLLEYDWIPTDAFVPLVFLTFFLICSKMKIKYNIDYSNSSVNIYNFILIKWI